MAVVVKSKDGLKRMVLDDGFAASYENGKWVDKALFNGYELEKHFTRVKDKTEAFQVLCEARKALGLPTQVAHA